jgi:hypothetical protein
MPEAYFFFHLMCGFAKPKVEHMVLDVVDPLVYLLIRKKRRGRRGADRMLCG